MKLKYDILANNKFQYEIDRIEFNKLMSIKKTVDRYDTKGVKKVKIIKNDDNTAKATFGRHKPERIKSEYMKGPFAVVFLSTPSSLADDNETDHYLKQATFVVEEGEILRVYRDSMNDGYTEAHFCDDTTMLILWQDAEKNKRYFKVEGEPTEYNSWRFENEEDTVNNHFKEIIEKYKSAAAEELSIDPENIYVVIQLENV